MSTRDASRQQSSGGTDIHPLLRELLLARRDPIRAAALRVSLELNARPSEVVGPREALAAMLSCALDDVISTAQAGTRLVVATKTPDISRSTVSTSIACGEQRFEKVFETSEGEGAADASGMTRVSSPGRDCTVLLVDDDPDTVALLRRALERRGYTVLSAISVREAAELGRSRPFDVLVSDLHLTDGTGIDLMHALGRPSRAIALSGASSSDDFARVIQAGFRRLLTKPVTLTMIEAAISELLP